MSLKIKNEETVLFIGDSITDCNRRNSERPLGCGYVKLFHDLALLREPRKLMRVINRGVDGDTVVGLRDRWHDDVLRHRPDWLSIKIGINDLHRGLNPAVQAIPPLRYAEAYENILQRTRKVLPDCRLLLIDPFYISAETSPASMRCEVLKRLPEYLKVVAGLSRKYGARHVRTHQIFQKLLRFHDADILCPEPVHPYLTGHLAIAEAVYRAFSV